MTNNSYIKLFSCIDNTSLNGDDTCQSIEQLCRNSMQMQNKELGIAPVAAVCVYPVFVGMAKSVLHKSLDNPFGREIKVASVAGAFPSGQSPIEVKLKEIQYALDEGADEIDMVISRGLFLEGKSQVVSDEIAAVRQLCGNKTLKVILETGELQTRDNIYNASMMAMEAGADFIKTSTGKIATGATIEAAQIMLQAIQDYGQKSGKIVGFKAAGGISTLEQALPYLQLAEKMLGKEFITNQKFRIGASRLTGRLFSLLTL